MPFDIKKALEQQILMLREELNTLLLSCWRGMLDDYEDKLNFSDNESASVLKISENFFITSVRAKYLFFVINRLASILKHTSAPDLPSVLKLFLDDIWMVIGDTGFSYTSLPCSAENQTFYLIAQYIVESEPNALEETTPLTRAIRALMPGISESIKLIGNLNISSLQNIFKTHIFSKRTNTLIPLQSVIEGLRDTIESLKKISICNTFVDIDSIDNSHYYLAYDDIKPALLHSHEMRQLEKDKKEYDDAPSKGHLIKDLYDLCDLLHENSRSRLGEDFDLVAGEAIYAQLPEKLAFYTNLSEEDKQKFPSGLKKELDYLIIQASDEKERDRTISTYETCLDKRTAQLRDAIIKNKTLLVNLSLSNRSESDEHLIATCEKKLKEHANELLQKISDGTYDGQESQLKNYCQVIKKINSNYYQYINLLKFRRPIFELVESMTLSQELQELMDKIDEENLTHPIKRELSNLTNIIDQCVLEQDSAESAIPPLSPAEKPLYLRKMERLKNTLLFWKENLNENFNPNVNWFLFNLRIRQLAELRHHQYAMKMIHAWRLYGIDAICPREEIATVNKPVTDSSSDHSVTVAVTTQSKTSIPESMQEAIEYSFNTHTFSCIYTEIPSEKRFTLSKHDNQVYIHDLEMVSSELIWWTSNDHDNQHFAIANTQALRDGEHRAFIDYSGQVALVVKKGEGENSLLLKVTFNALRREPMFQHLNFDEKGESELTQITVAQRRSFDSDFFARCNEILHELNIHQRNHLEANACITPLSRLVIKPAGRDVCTTPLRPSLVCNRGQTNQPLSAIREEVKNTIVADDFEKLQVQECLLKAFKKNKYEYCLMLHSYVSGFRENGTINDFYDGIEAWIGNTQNLRNRKYGDINSDINTLIRTKRALLKEILIEEIRNYFPKYKELDAVNPLTRTEQVSPAHDFENNTEMRIPSEVDPDVQENNHRREQEIEQQIVEDEQMQAQLYAESNAELSHPAEVEDEPVVTLAASLLDAQEMTMPDSEHREDEHTLSELEQLIQPETSSIHLPSVSSSVLNEINSVSNEAITESNRSPTVLSTTNINRDIQNLISNFYQIRLEDAKGAARFFKRIKINRQRQKQIQRLEAVLQYANADADEVKLGALLRISEDISKERNLFDSAMKKQADHIIKVHLQSNNDLMKLKYSVAYTIYENKLQQKNLFYHRY